MQWFSICSVDDLQPDSGVCALFEGRQIAIFCLWPGGYVSERSHANELNHAAQIQPIAKVYAVGNYDPFGKANVLSRGIIGDIGGQPVVASPLYKQHFNLRTGVCLEDETVKIPVYTIRIKNGSIQVNLSSLPQDGEPAL